MGNTAIDSRSDSVGGWCSDRPSSKIDELVEWAFKDAEEKIGPEDA
jgi:hypothetical protein